MHEDDVDEIISTPQEEEVLEADVGDFNELSNLVARGGEVNLTKDYKLGSEFNDVAIMLYKSITINGNGHTIDASGKATIFYIQQDSNYVLNNITFINGIGKMGSNSNLGGAINILDSHNVSIINCKFINNSATYGGAVSTHGNNITFINNTFDNNKGRYGSSIETRGDNYRFINNKFLNANDLSYESVIYAVSNNVYFESNLFNNITCAIDVRGNNIVIDKSNFTNAISKVHSIVAVQSEPNKTYFNITNSIFINCSVIGSHGVLFSSNRYSYIDNCYFNNVSTVRTGGGIYLQAPDSIISNCYFNECSANNAGAIYSTDKNVLIENVTIQNSKVNYYGGGIYIYGENTTLRNAIVVNSSGATYGGAIFWHKKDGILDNVWICNSSSSSFAGSIYIGNEAENISAENIIILNSKSAIGGGIYWAGNVGVLNNTFINNTDAYHSGALYIQGDDVVVSNSNFTNNHADYGAGAIGSRGDNVKIINSKFINNHANNYGGTLSLTDASVENVSIKQTSAVFGGAIFTINSTIQNVEFEDYSAVELGSKIFAINKVNIIDCDVASSELYENNLTETLTVSGQYQGMYTIYNGTKYDIFMDEWYLSYWTSTFRPHVAILDPSFKLLRNRIDSSDISGYVKLLLYYYYPIYRSYMDYCVYVFSDTDYRSSTYSLVNYVVNAYDNGARAPDVRIVGDNAIFYEYYGLITPAHFKNTFFMKTTTVPIDINVTKECLNQNIIVGDTIQFRINVTNTGGFKLENVYIDELFNSSQLKFLPDSLNSNWTFNESSNTFTYKNILDINETVNLILSFKTLINGTIKNNVSVGWKDKTFDSDEISIRVYNPNLNVSKIALPGIVAEGSRVEFEIIVHNTGDMDLTNVSIVEESFEGLTYAGHHATNVWSYAFVNGKHTWYLNEDLLLGADHRLFVYFNTTSTGNFTNYATVKTNQTKDKKVNATVKVLDHEFTVEKVALNNITQVGDQTVFEIVVHNTGETDLNGVFVIEDFYEGLVFDHVRQATRWTQSTTSDGKLKWTFNEVLPSHEWVFLFMVFNTTEVGNFTNIVIVGSDSTINKTANATVWVNETVYRPEGDEYKLNISITTIHPIVLVGNQTMFEIVVHNVGNAILHNVTVAEHLFDDLIFDSFRDFTGYWNKLPTTLSSNGLLGAVQTRDLTWQMNDVLYPGEYAGFFVVFNTIKPGTFSNTVLGSSDETDGVYASDDVEVVKPDYTIEKSLLNEKTVNIGDEIYFQVLITNTGKVNLTNLIIKESPENGLEFVRLIDEDEMWIQEGLTFKLKENLLPEEEVGFEIVFKTSSVGKFTNTVISSVDLLDDKNASANVRVFPKDPIYDVSIDTKVIDSPVYVGETSLVEITVTNTGNDDLDNVFVYIDLNTGLPYLSYTNGSRNWTKSDNVYYLEGILKVGKTATFYILVNTTKAGNFSNVASVGFNNTTKDNSTFVVEVLDNETPVKKNETGLYMPIVIIKPPVVPVEPVEVNNKKDEKSHHYVGDNKATGNPIWLLLIVLLNLVLLRRNK